MKEPVYEQKIPINRTKVTFHFYKTSNKKINFDSLLLFCKLFYSPFFLIKKITVVFQIPILLLNAVTNYSEH